MRREHKKKLSKAELEQITSRRPVTRYVPSPQDAIILRAIWDLTMSARCIQAEKSAKRGEGARSWKPFCYRKQRPTLTV